MRMGKRKVCGGGDGGERVLIQKLWEREREKEHSDVWLAFSVCVAAVAVKDD